MSDCCYLQLILSVLMMSSINIIIMFTPLPSLSSHPAPINSDDHQHWQSSRPRTLSHTAAGIIHTIHTDTQI